MRRREFFNQRAARWDETVSERDPEKLERMSLRLDLKPGAVVLDVGTGTGVFIPYILKRIGGAGRIIAVDFADEMLKLARAKGFGGSIYCLCADVASIPLKDGACDNVVCYSSFPHFPDKPRALAEMRRVLSPGGQLFICHTSSRSSINNIHRQIPDVHNDLIPERDEMQMLLSTAGFTDVLIADDSESYLARARKP